MKKFFVVLFIGILFGGFAIYASFYYHANSELINSLLMVLDNDPMFYSTNGVAVNTMENSFKLKLIYTHILNNNLSNMSEMASEYYGSTNCLNGFVTDVGENALVSTNKCTVNRVDKSVFIDINKKLFNDEIFPS